MLGLNRRKWLVHSIHAVNCFSFLRISYCVSVPSKRFVYFAMVICLMISCGYNFGFDLSWGRASFLQCLDVAPLAMFIGRCYLLLTILLWGASANFFSFQASLAEQFRRDIVCVNVVLIDQIGHTDTACVIDRVYDGLSLVAGIQVRFYHDIGTVCILSLHLVTCKSPHGSNYRVF